MGRFFYSDTDNQKEILNHLVKQLVDETKMRTQYEKQ
jgi:hypothetical protein